jgi:hypothetical protein
MDLEIDEGSTSQWNQQQPHVVLQLGRVGGSLSSWPRRRECPSSRAAQQGMWLALVAGADKRETAHGRAPGVELCISSQSTSLSPTSTHMCSYCDRMRGWWWRQAWRWGDKEEQDQLELQPSVAPGRTC